jgi:phosphate starvation-inducible protein PhoH and related proteins
VDTSTLSIQVPGNHIMPGLLGQRDEFLRLVEAEFEESHIHVRGNLITVNGGAAPQVVKLFNELVSLIETGETLDSELVDRTIEMVKAEEKPSQILTQELLRSPNGRRVRPKSSGQKDYVEAIGKNTITFSIGPAGTGKTWLAVAAAVQALHAKQVNRLILTRPAVEAGERLGFLPGDLMSKVDPYMRPLFDALHDMLDGENVQRLLERGTIEVAPLAFMRGRTLNDAFIILDEAQNTTPEQMKMFLTRIGFGSKVVVTGDMTQVDVPGGKCGLVGLEKLLGQVEGIEFVTLGGRDIVRHRIVQSIVDAYETASKSNHRKKRS